MALSHYNKKYFAWQKKMGNFGGIANQIMFIDLIKEKQKILDFGCGGGPSIDIDVEQEFGCDQDIGGCEGSCSTTGSFSVPVGRLLGVFFLVLGALFRRRS